MFQKIFATLLTYIIGFQLVVSAAPGQMHFLSSTAYALDCPSGLVANEMLGRCVTSEQAAQIKDASKMCESAGDDAAKKQCYRGVIEGEMKDANITGPGKVNTDMVSVGLAMISLASAAMFLAVGGNSGCPGATSAWLIAGSAVAVMAGEVFSAMTYKKKLKEAEEKFKSVADSSKDETGSSSSDNANATSTQAEAFQAMIELEEATISAAKTKNMLYMVATAGYALAAVMSTIELIQYNTAMSNPATAATAALMYQCNNAIASHTSPEYSGGLHASSIAESRSFEEIYIDNYFLHNQRVPFSSYKSTLIDQAEDLAQLSYLHEEQMLLLQGKHSGGSLAHYDEVRTKVLSTPNLSSEDLSVVKLARKIALSFTIPSAQASSFLSMAAMAGGLAMPALTGGGSVLKKLYLLPHTRAALAAAMTLNNAFMIMKTNKEKKKAEERKAFIEKLKAQTEAAGKAFGCTGADRVNLAKPDCYCFSETGNVNPARSNSTVCKQYFGSKPNLASRKDSNKNGVSTVKNCVSSNGNLDSSCSCRQTNSCVSIKAPAVVGNVPTGTVLGNLPDTINGLNNGTLSPADVNEVQMGAAAARLNELNKKLLNDPSNKKLADQLKKGRDQSDKLIKDIQRNLASSPGLFTSPSSGSAILSASSPVAALEALKKDVQQQSAAYQGAAAASGGGAQGKKADEFSLDALNSNGGVTVADEGQQQLAENMASNFDIGNGDINTDSGANIFNILSNRYQRSGMRRLFGGEALIPADKPAENQINQ